MDYDYGSPHQSYDGRPTELTNFDKLAVSVSWFGAIILIGLHFTLVPTFRTMYTGLDDLVPGLTRFVMNKGFGVSLAMLMTFLAYYGARMRKLYDNKLASNLLLLAMLTSLIANGALIYALYSPAGASLNYLRGG